MWSDPDTVGGGVSMEKTSVAGGASGRRRRCPPPPSAPTSSPRGPRGRASRGSRSGRSAGSAEPVASVSMIGLPYPACSGSTTPPPARWRRCELRTPGQVSMYVCGPTVYGVPHLGHGRFSLVFDVLRRYLHLHRARGHATCPTSPTSTTRSSTGPPTRGVDIAEVAAAYEAVWWEAMDALGVLRPDRRPACHRLRGPDGRPGRRPGRPRRRLRDGRRRLPVGRRTCPATGCWPASRSTRCGPGPGWRRTRRSGRPSTSSCGRRPSRASPWESPWGPGRPGLAHRVRGHVARPAGRGLRPARRGDRPRSSRTTRTSGPRPWPPAGPSPATGCTTGGSPSEGEKMSKSLGNFTSLSDLLARSDARAYRLLVLRSHYRSPIEVTPDTVARRRVGPGPAGRAGPPVRPRRPVGHRTGGRRRRGRASMPTAVARFRRHMDDDLDTPGALAGVFDLVRRANAAADGGDRSGALPGGPDGGPAVRGPGTAPAGRASRPTRRRHRRAGPASGRGPGRRRLGPGRCPAPASWRPRAGWSRTAPTGTRIRRR